MHDKEDDMKKIFAILMMVLLMATPALAVSLSGTSGGVDDADLTTIAGLTVAQGKFIIGSSSPAWSASAYTLPTAVCTSGYLLKSDGTNMVCSNTLSVTIDDSAAQFKDASVATKLVKINPTSEGTATITPTGAYNLTYTLTADSTPTFPTEGTLYGTKTDSITSANLAGSLSNETGTGVAVFATSPSFTTSILPVSNADIGSAAAEWGDVYLKDSAIIYGQADQSNTITSAATGWTFAKPVTIADVTNSNYVQVTNNSGGRNSTASKWELYPDAGVWKASENGTEFTIQKAGACTALASDGAGTALTVGSTNCYTLTVDDNEDQTITFSGAGYAGQEITIIFTTAGASDETVTFHATLVSSVGTLTLGTDAGKFYTVRFISDGSHWYEVSRTAVQT